MNGVMDRIQVSGFRTLCEVKLTGCSAVLSLYAHLKVLLRAVRNNLAEELSELCGMLRLFVSGLLPV